MMQITSFLQAERYMLATIDEMLSRRTSYKLDRMQAFLRELGDPHLAYPTIHIGGTSGKGSTCAMIAAALQAAGRRTGLHTKPHLHSMTERARVDGQPISPERFAALLDAMMPAIERTTASRGRPTYYETLLALAFSYFAQEHVDVAVVEVGLGGRLDGTNVLAPVVAAITSIGYDHTDVLGNTIEEIAFEKAGIAKRNVPLVLAAVPAAAQAVIVRYARGAGARLIRVEDVVRVDLEHANSQGQRLAVQTPRGPVRFELSALGGFQRANAGTAIAVLEQLGDNLRPNLADIEHGFEAVAVPGRMEVARRTPPVIFDIAHNIDKAESLAAALTEAFGGRRIHYVVAIGETKDAPNIVKALAAIPSTFTFTSFTASGRRAVSPSRLATIAESLGTWGRAIEDPIEAFTVARRLAGAEDVVVVTGSTFVVAELRAWYAPTAV